MGWVVHARGYAPSVVVLVMECSTTGIAAFTHKTTPNALAAHQLTQSVSESTTFHPVSSRMSK